MSVSGGCLEAKVVLGCEVVLYLAEETDGKEGGANDNVEAMESGGNEEGSPINTVGDCEGRLIIL